MNRCDWQRTKKEKPIPAGEMAAKHKPITKFKKKKRYFFIYTAWL